MADPRLNDVWLSRDYPMLVEIMRIVEEEGLSIQAFQWKHILETEEDQQRALYALRARGLIETRELASYIDSITNVSGEAYTLVGLHPSGEDLKERLVSALEQLAEKTSDPAEASKLTQAAKQFGMLSRDVAAGVAAALPHGQLGV